MSIDTVRLSVSGFYLFWHWKTGSDAENDYRITVHYFFDSRDRFCNNRAEAKREKINTKSRHRVDYQRISAVDSIQYCF